MTNANIFDLEQYLEAVSPAVGLRIPDEFRSEALNYLRAAARIAQPLLEFELEQSIEPAITFSIPKPQV
jgi:hypothetical protein